jgi:Flp pilus assembly protein TadB
MTDTQPRRRKPTVPYAAVAMTAGAAFAIVAVLHAPGIAYVVVAIVAGLCYSLLAMYNRRACSAAEAELSPGEASRSGR